MAITVAGSNAVQSGTTSCTPIVPVAAGIDDIMLICVGNKPHTATPSVDQSYALIGSVNTGSGEANGLDVGDIRTSVFWKEHTGTEANPIVSVTGGNPVYALMLAFNKTLNDWLVAGAGGGDITSGTAFDVAAPTDPGFSAGDWVICQVTLPTDNVALTAITLSIPGCTLGTVTTTGGVTTVGNQGRLYLNRAEILSGTSTGPPSLAATLNGSATGSAYFTRIRESTNSPPVASFDISVAFNASASSDPDGSIASYSWNWGDGTANGSGVSPTHSYAQPGTYVVALTVTDNTGLTNTTQQSITISGDSNTGYFFRFF